MADRHITRHSQPHDSGLIPVDYHDQGLEVHNRTSAHQANWKNAHVETIAKELPHPPADRGKRLFEFQMSTLLFIGLSAILVLAIVGTAAAAAVISSQKTGEVARLSKQLLAKDAEIASMKKCVTSHSIRIMMPFANVPSCSNSATNSPNANGFQYLPLPIQASSVLGQARTSCPDTSNQTFRPEGSNVTFLRECNWDYPYDDLARIPLTTMEDCMLLCVAWYLSPQSVAGPCKGVSWVFGEIQGASTTAFCFLKLDQRDGPVTGLKKLGVESARIVETE